MSQSEKEQWKETEFMKRFRALLMEHAKCLKGTRHNLFWEEREIWHDLEKEWEDRRLRQVIKEELASAGIPTTPSIKENRDEDATQIME